MSAATAYKPSGTLRLVWGVGQSNYKETCIYVITYPRELFAQHLADIRSSCILPLERTTYNLFLPRRAI